jgi:L-lactate dehydrogenase (cytochrome)
VRKGAKGGRTTGAYIDASLNWSDLAWIKRCTKLPVVLKGIQSAADAKLALEHGCQGIVVSNHVGHRLKGWPVQG